MNSLNSQAIKPRFSIVVEALPAASDPEGVRRVRLALKRLLRSFGLRAVTVRPEPAGGVEGLEAVRTVNGSLEKFPKDSFPPSAFARDMY